MSTETALDHYVPGQRVRAYWTSSNRNYEADGTITRVNAKTVRVDIDGASVLMSGLDWKDGKLVAYNRTPHPRADWNTAIPVPGTKLNRVEAVEAATVDAIEQAKDAERARLQRKADRFATFADNAERSANAFLERSRALTRDIPLGQPILVGHHSERRHRRTLQQSRDAMDKFVSEAERAARWNYRVSGIEREMRRKGLRS